MLVQVPPLTQGFKEQSAMGTSQRPPVKSGGHTHINVSSATQVPPF